MRIVHDELTEIANRAPASAKGAAFRGALIYCLLAGAWILISGYVLSHSVMERESLAVWELLKGLFFVLVTAGALGWVLYGHTRTTDAAWRTALQARGALLTIINAAPLAIISVSEGGIVRTWNRGAEKMLGWQAPAVIGQPCPAVPDYALEKYRETIRKAMAGEAVRNMECNLLHHDGQVIPAECCSAALRDAEGEVIGAVMILQDITERRRAEAEKLDLSRKLMHAEDRERRRIAKELHDSTAQDLVAALMNLHTLRESPEVRGTGREALLEDSAALLEKCGEDLRTLSYVLHPPRLDEAGLTGAVRHLARGFSARTGIATAVTLDDSLGRLEEDAELVLFRITQESLGNIHRHAGATTAGVALRRLADHVELEIADNGRGFPDGVLGHEFGGANGAPVGVGIPGMRERLRQIGGCLDLGNGPVGAKVLARVPLSEDAA